jgi:serine/threonine protein kinase
MEARTLRALAAANAPFVPRLLAAVVRSGGSWPLHIISPRGRPLAAALEEVLAAAGSPQDKRRLRLEFADRVLRQTQAAARAAHGLRVVHCDIRVDNCLVDADGDVCLIDWGLARERGEPALKIGVPPFALGDQFNGTVTSCAAAERVDLAAAALLWLCVAYGQACRAPWPTRTWPRRAPR